MYRHALRRPPHADVVLQTPIALVIIALALAWFLIGTVQSAVSGPRYVVPATSADVTLLARLIQAEAGGEPYLGMVAVGAVVVNRVQSGSFPDTVSGVIEQAGQFTTVQEGLLPAHPNDAALRAAREALGGADPTHGALYFHNPSIPGSAASQAFWRSRPVLIVIGHHAFTG